MLRERLAAPSVGICSIVVHTLAQVVLTVFPDSRDLTTAYQINDNIIVLYRGTVAEAGDVELVVRQPRHPYTQLLVQSGVGGRSKFRPAPVETMDGTTQVVDLMSAGAQRPAGAGISGARAGNAPVGQGFMKDR
jgi:ABC-type dipeptide/oligopeptide/nickel transport system ATPase component